MELSGVLKCFEQSLLSKLMFEHESGGTFTGYILEVKKTTTT